MLSPQELLMGFVVTHPSSVPILLLVLKVQGQLLQLLPAECGVVRPWKGKTSLTTCGRVWCPWASALTAVPEIQASGVF